MILFGLNSFIKLQFFEFADFIFQFFKRTALLYLKTTRTKHKADLLIQLHTFIVLFLCWPVGADKIVESYDEMKRLTSDVNSLKGEPLHSSARPKDIASLNVARQQELAERFFRFRCLELQIKDMVKPGICEPHTLLATVITSPGPRFKSWSEDARKYELPG